MNKMIKYNINYNKKKQINIILILVIDVYIYFYTCFALYSCTALNNLIENSG